MQHIELEEVRVDTWKDDLVFLEAKKGKDEIASPVVPKKRVVKRELSVVRQD